MKKRLEPWRQLLFSALILLTISMAMTACSSDENDKDATYYSGKIAYIEDNFYYVWIHYSPKENTTSPQIGSMVFFPKENLSREYHEGDEIFFIIRKFEKVIPEGFTTGFPFVYSCIVEPYK